MFASTMSKAVYFIDKSLVIVDHYHRWMASELRFCVRIMYAPTPVAHVTWSDASFETHYKSWTDKSVVASNFDRI